MQPGLDRIRDATAALPVSNPYAPAAGSAHPLPSASDAEERAHREWLMARVWMALGMPDLAVHHAHQAQELCEHHGLRGPECAFVYATLARGYASTNDRSLAERYRELARRAAGAIADADERRTFLRELDGAA